MTTTLNIKGMTCPNCQKHVEEALRELPGVTKAEANHKKGTAKVTHSESISKEAFESTVGEAGYTLVDVL